MSRLRPPRRVRFFFQAEDGIRDRNVTGVQTCALPMSAGADCLIIVPHDRPELYDRLKAHFAQRANIHVRLDARTGARAASELNVFAVGGGSLSPDVRADVEAEIRSLGGR